MNIEIRFYILHPSVKTLLEEKRSIGREYDYTNPSTVYYTMPGWILDEHDTNSPDNEGIIANALWNLTQIIGSYFDNTANLIKSMPSLISNRIRKWFSKTNSFYE